MSPTVRTTLGIPVRDGIELAADVWMRDGAQPGPVVLVRTPYGKGYSLWPAFIDIEPTLDRGYTIVCQDVRGRGQSGGNWDPFVNEELDGFDTVEWIAAQPWCDGRVVMTGMSYQGQTQWAAAAAQPAGLAAIAPVMSSRTWGEGALFTNGVREIGMMGTWLAANLAEPSERWMGDLERSFTDRDGLSRIAPYSARWFTEESSAPYWARERSITTDPAVPALVIGGWYDLLLRGTLDSWARSAHPDDRLILGPWGHVTAPSNLVGDRDLGYPGSVVSYGLHARILDFFDDVLDGVPPRAPRVHAYELDSYRWVDHHSWPPSEENLELALGAGTLDAGELSPTFRGGRGLLIEMPLFGHGPADQSPLAERDDVLVLRQRVPRACVAAGPAEVTVTVEPAGTPRQWSAVLCIVRSDGRLDTLADGVANEEPGSSSVEIDLGHIAVTLDDTTELVVMLSGGWFPRWEPIVAPGRRTVHETRLQLRVLARD